MASLQIQQAWELLTEVEKAAYGGNIEKFQAAKDAELKRTAIFDERYLQKKAEYEEAWDNYQSLKGSLFTKKREVHNAQLRWGNSQSAVDQGSLKKTTTDYNVTEGDVDRALDKATMFAFGLYKY